MPKEGFDLILYQNNVQKNVRACVFYSHYLNDIVNFSKSFAYRLDQCLVFFFPFFVYTRIERR